MIVKRKIAYVVNGKEYDDFDTAENAEQTFVKENSELVKKKEEERNEEFKNLENEFENLQKELNDFIEKYDEYDNEKVETDTDQNDWTSAKRKCIF